jgi:hypothetical protein
MRSSMLQVLKGGPIYFIKQVYYPEADYDLEQQASICYEVNCVFSKNQF